jgi:ABC-type transport system involved in multi-copper enzyme maturation permease subunit
MKFLAIMKDSLREAIDSKVFFVMVALSSVMILLACTLSFKPQPAEELFKALVILLNTDPSDLSIEKLQRFGFSAKQAGLRLYDVKGVDALNGSLSDPDGDYLVTVVVRYAETPEAEKVRKDPQETLDLLKNRFGSLDEMRVVQVTKVQVAPPDNHYLPETPNAKEIYFELQTHPTSATRRLWPHEPSVLFGAFSLSALKNVPLGLQLYVIEDTIINGLGAWLAILLSIVITSFFIPNMLRKGTIDLLLVKPIRRPVLLVLKYIGGLFFIFLNTAFVVSGVWLAMGWRSGIWPIGFLLTIFVITFFFAILYAVSTLFAVLTRSTIVAILMTCFTWGFLFVVGLTYQFVDGDSQKKKIEQEKEGETYSEGWFTTGVRCVHYVLPRTRDLDILTTQLLIRDLLTANQIREQKLKTTPISWGESITVSAIFIVLLLGFSCWWFATRDY